MGGRQAVADLTTRRTIGAMDARDESLALARRELVVVAVLLVAAARLVGRDNAFAVAGILPAAILLAGLGAFGRSEPRDRSFEALLVPAVLTGGAAAAVHLVPIGLGLVPALVAFAVVLDRVLALELRLVAQAAGVTDADRSRVLLAAIAAAFVAFTGVATLVPGGLAEPGGAAFGGSVSLTETGLVALAAVDALVALVLGFRVATFRFGTVRDAIRSALTYGIVVAVAAGAVRAIDLPRLVGPAVLTLVFYLWDALHGSAPARRRDPRFLWELLLLVLLGIVVVAWNLRLRG
jgi:hypothetical protein